MAYRGVEIEPRTKSQVDTKQKRQLLAGMVHFDNPNGINHQIQKHPSKYSRINVFSEAME